MRLTYHGGFSFPELLVVMAILSIVAVSSFSNQIYYSYQHWYQRHALTKDTDELLALITRARSLAIRSGQPVYLCGGVQCDGQWSTLAYLSDGNASPTIFSSIQFSSEVRIRWQGFPLLRAYIVFLPSGLSSYQNGSFYLCREEQRVKRIVISQSGRAYLDGSDYGVEKC